MMSRMLLSLSLFSASVPASRSAGPHNHHQSGPSGHEGFAEHHNSTYRCAAACARLSQSPLTVYTANTTDYNLSQTDYWSSFQSDVSPTCFVEPSCAEDVAAIITVVRETQCPFAVKSGGHAAFTGASNIPNGITILLHQLNELSLSEDNKITHVGTGNIWIDVYDYLTPRNLSVIGGRVAAIGTGGLLLGGGVSFFSNRYGWACDNVVNYELVTASSQILQVNATSDSDLFWALRGGGNNFGIVTRLDLETFFQGPMWGGRYITSSSSKEALIDALYWYGYRAPEDVDAAVYVAFGYLSTYNLSFANVELTHAKNIADPPIFENFTSLSTTLVPPSLASDRNISDLAIEINASNPNGLRETYQTHNFLLSRELMSDILDIFTEEIAPIKDSVAGLVPTVIFQVTTTSQISHMDGSALGINATEGPLLLMNLSFYWNDTRPSIDELVLGVARMIVEKSVARAKETGAYHRYIYQNYAAAWQDVFAGYGEENLRRLRSVSRGWDPEGVFQKLQPGYFKLW